MRHVVIIDGPITDGDGGTFYSAIAFRSRHADLEVNRANGETTTVKATGGPLAEPGFGRTIGDALESLSAHLPAT